jgi:hypothetical protein
VVDFQSSSDFVSGLKLSTSCPVPELQEPRYSLARQKLQGKLQADQVDNLKKSRGGYSRSAPNDEQTWTRMIYLQELDHPTNIVLGYPEISAERHCRRLRPFLRRHRQQHLILQISNGSVEVVRTVGKCLLIPMGLEREVLHLWQARRWYEMGKVSR